MEYPVYSDDGVRSAFCVYRQSTWCWVAVCKEGGKITKNMEFPSLLQAKNYCNYWVKTKEA